jgi:hypothetical protein
MYRAIFDWFDGLLLGLTATPKDQVDHTPTDCFVSKDGVPADNYYETGAAGPSRIEESSTIWGKLRPRGPRLATNRPFRCMEAPRPGHVAEAASDRPHDGEKSRRSAGEVS